MRVTNGAMVVGALSVLAGAAAAAGPAAVWVSQPVEPGEAVMVYGGPWTNVTAVELSGPEGRTVTPLKVTGDCVTFVCPADWPQSAFGAKVVTGVGTAEVRVNAPEVWWLQGDAGRGATPGGWLRAFGRCVGYGGKAWLELRGNGGTRKLAAPGGLYAVRAAIPADLPSGEYEVFLNNGLAAEALPAGRVKVALAAEPWPERVFDITAYGAIANDNNDDTRAIRAALADIVKNNGGILYLPRGRFGMRGELALPPKTLLRGAGMALSQLYWLDEDDPKGALVSGTRDFGIEEIFLSAANIDEGIVVQPPAAGETWKNANILLRRVRTRFLHTDTITAEESFRRSRASGRAFLLDGEYVRVIGCDFYATKGSSILHGDYLYACSNRFDGVSCGYLGGRQCIFEDNDHEGRGISFANGSRNFYMKGNRIGAVYNDGDRETFTTDGGRTTYNGNPVSVSPNGLTLKQGAWRDSMESWIGETVLIIGGRGAGQLRHIREIRGREVEVDRPWDIVPDTESFVVIGKERDRLLFIDNEDRDGNPFQLYGSAVDVVFAGNRFQRNSGLQAFGMSKGGSPEPSWFIQFLGNEILEGNAVRGPMSFNVPALDGWLAFYDRGIVKPLTYPENRVGIMRRNVLHGNAYISSHGRVENLLIENNVVKNADRGISVAGSVEGAIVRGNRFEGVLRPFELSGSVQVGAADRLIAGLSAVEASLKADLPGEWKALEAEALALAKQQLTEGDADKAASAILLKAARALSAKVGDRAVPSAAVAALCGIDLSQKNPWMFGKLAAGKSTKVGIGSDFPSWALPAALTATPGAFEGWTIRSNAPVDLMPGSPVGFALLVTRPDESSTTFALPVTYRLSGEGWVFTFEERYVQDTMDVEEFLVAGPFRNTSGKGVDTEVHPPELRLDVNQSYDTLDGQRLWVAVKRGQNRQVDLSGVFSHAEMATAHAVAVVRAKRPVQVKVDFGSNQSALCFVNGERIGSSARRDAVGGRTVDFRQGDNLIHVITSHGSGAWPLKLSVTAVDPTQPGDLCVVEAGALKDSPALAASGEKIPQGKDLPDGMGVDWKLIYSDDFNRSRIGGGWTCQSPGWMTQATCLMDKALSSEAGWGFLSFKQKVSVPVRIEFDLVVGKAVMSGVYLCPEGLAWHDFWGKPKGRGYCLSLGWHDAKNNRVMRDAETVLLDEKAPMLEAGKRYHIVAQFVPPQCLLTVDGKPALSYQDTQFQPGLDQIGVFTLGGDAFDNVRVYTAKGE